MLHKDRDFERIIETARTLYENLKADITNSKDRMEHIRLTALAQEAHNLLTDLLIFEVGLVYTHTASTDEYLLRDVDQKPEQEPLDLPEFKSPYTPPTRLE
jgi:hypothetical protein